MLYVVYRVDREGSRPLREKLRAEHAAYLEEQASAIKMLGPTLSVNDAAPNGTLAILECPDFETALAWAWNDPYSRAGVFQTIAVKPWKVMRGRL